MPARAWGFVLVAIVLAAAGLAAGGRAARMVLAVEILDALRRPGPDSWLARATPAPKRNAIELDLPRERIGADLYRPASGGSRVPVLLVPGLVEEGKDDPRVAPFASLLARAGFTVVVPDLPSFRALRVTPDHPRELAAALAAVAARVDLAPAGRVGLFGISYAGGIALLVALDPALAARVPYVAVVGGYADLDSALRYLATGRTFVRGRMRIVSPTPYGQLVFLRTFEEWLDVPADRATLDAMAARRMDDPRAPLDDLARGLGPKGRLIYDLFEGGEPDRVPALIDSLPAELRARMAELSPDRHELGALRARLYLVHARDDGTFPVSEALRIVERVEEGRGRTRQGPRPRLVVLDELQHVEPEPWHRDPWGFLTRDLPEAVRLAGWWYALLGER